MDFPATLSRELGQAGDRLLEAFAEALEAARSEERARAATERDALRARLADMTASRDALAAQVAAMTTQLGEATRRASQLAAHVTELEAARDALRARAEQLVASSESLALDLAAQASEREAAVAAREAIAQELARALTDLTAERTELASVRAAAARDLSDAEARLVVERDARQRQEAVARASTGATPDVSRDRFADHLAAVVDQMAAASTVDEVLAACVGGLAVAFTRVVAVRPDTAPPGIAAVAGVAVQDHNAAARALAAWPHTGAALRSGRPAVATGDEAARAPLAGQPSLAVAVPVQVSDNAAAVVYADTDGLAVDSQASTPLRLAAVLGAHASLRVAQLGREQALAEELRGYATMLLDEVEYVYRADAGARLSEADRLARLRENLRCARQFFEQRARTEAPRLASLLEEMLAGVMTARDGTPFGRDLARVALEAHPERAPLAG